MSNDDERDQVGVPEDPGTVDHADDDDLDDDDVGGDPEVGRVGRADDLLADADHLEPGDADLVGDVGRGDREADHVDLSGQADRGIRDLDEELPPSREELGR